VGATWGRRPHNFLAVGAIAPIESAPMCYGSYKLLYHYIIIIDLFNVLCHYFYRAVVSGISALLCCQHRFRVLFYFITLVSISI